MKLKPMQNKKGSLMDILIWIIAAFIIMLFFGVWIYGFDLVTNQLLKIDTPVGNTNVSDIARDSFGVVNSLQTQGLHSIAFVMIFVMGLSIMVTNFLQKSHPVFFILYIIVVIVAIIVSVFISNQYESLTLNSTIGSTLTDFTAANFIMINLPIWTTVFGIAGGIFLFMGIRRDEGLGGGIS